MAEARPLSAHARARRIEAGKLAYPALDSRRTFLAAQTRRLSERQHDAEQHERSALHDATASAWGTRLIEGPSNELPPEAEPPRCECQAPECPGIEH